MIFNTILDANPFRKAAWLVAVLITLGNGGAFAQAGLDARGQCWKKPAPETLEEIFKSSSSTRRQQAQTEQLGAANTVLLVSNASLKAAYAAGLLVGWAETGDRPRFAAITAVGTGALIAPFAFIGPDGDQAIADIFNCDARDIGQVAEHAASFLDENVLAAIAREHDAGRRLFIALPGSAARPETVWDIGLLAKSRAPGALALARDVLRAAVVIRMPLTPDDRQKAVMQTVPPNLAFRDPGAGREFLLPRQLASVAGAGSRYFLIHNDRLFWDESEEYIRLRNARSTVAVPAAALMPGYDVVRQALAANGGFRYASPKTASGLVPSGEFDLTYLRALFRHAYRQGRMGKAWTGEFPGLRQGASSL